MNSLNPLTQKFDSHFYRKRIETPQHIHRTVPVMKIIVTFFVLTIGANTFAQSQFTGANELTLDRAIRMALDSNYTERTAVNSLEVADLTKTRASDNLHALSAIEDYRTASRR